MKLKGDKNKILNHIYRGVWKLKGFLKDNILKPTNRKKKIFNLGRNAVIFRICFQIYNLRAQMNRPVWGKFPPNGENNNSSYKDQQSKS